MTSERHSRAVPVEMHGYSERSLLMTARSIHWTTSFANGSSGSLRATTPGPAESIPERPQGSSPTGPATPGGQPLRPALVVSDVDR